MESTTEQGFCITVGKFQDTFNDTTSERTSRMGTSTGRRLAIGPTWEALRDALHSLVDGRWWWAPHTWAGDRRKNENWRAATAVVLDLDFAAAWKRREDSRTGQVRWIGNHAAPTAKHRKALSLALLKLPPDLSRGTVLAHHTPRGARLVLMLSEPVTDWPLFLRAVKGAAALVVRWLRSEGLLAETTAPPPDVRDGLPLDRPGYSIDESFDPARVVYAPKALSFDPDDDDKPLQRTDEVEQYGDPDARFDAGWLADHAPASLTPTKTHTAQDHAPHPSWPLVEAALLATAPKAHRSSRGVSLCCPLHDDDNPSAVVYRDSLALFCNACTAPTSIPLDRWAARPLDRWAGPEGKNARPVADLARLLADLARLLTAPVQGEVFAPYWRTVGEWSADDTAGDWLSHPPAPRDWLLTVPPYGESHEEMHLLQRGIVGMLAAEGGIGKSMALVQLAIAVAAGRPWLARSKGEGRFPGFTTNNPHRDRVLLLLGEEDRHQARARLWRAVKEADLSPDEEAAVRDLVVVLPLEAVSARLMSPRNGQRGEAARRSEVADELERRLFDSGRWALVVIDPLSQFAGWDSETDNAAATEFVHVLRRLTKAPGNPTVLVSHHTGKSARGEGVRDATAARGVTGLGDAVRFMATMTRPKRKDEEDDDAPPPPLLQMAVPKNNYGPELWPFWLARGDGGVLRCATDDEVAAFKGKGGGKKAETKQADKGTNYRRL